MKVKTLLLGSAAAFAVVGGAQAADLTIAEPVDYVRVCDAFGTGYWYLPGTDTCIKVGGEVTFDINFHGLTSVLDGDQYGHEELGTGTGFQGDFDDEDVTNESNHSANWDFVTGAKITLTGKSQTELGDLIGSVTITASSNNSQDSAITDWYVDHGGGEDVDIYYTYGHLDTDRIFKIDEAYLQLNWLSAGYRDSTYQYSGGYIGATTYRGNKKTDQIRVTWAMGGFSLMLAAEDPRDRWGTSLGGIANMPDLIAAITWAQPNWDGKLSFGFAGPIANQPFFYGHVWGVNLGMTFGITENDDLRLNVAAGNGSTFVSSSDATNGLMNYSAFASWQHAWSPTWSSALTAAALWTDGDLVKYAISGGLVWEPVDSFSVQTRVIYENKNGDPSWAGRIQLKREIDP